jgi:hypothetical protein
MKKLGRFKINPEKLIKNDELLALRGGYGSVACACKKDGITLCTPEVPVDNCGYGYGSCKSWCDYYCPDYEEAICVG